MTKLLRILGVQLEPKLGDKDFNNAKIERLLEKNVWYKPDLVVLPEVFNVGIVTPKKFRDLAEEIPGPTYNKLSAWSKQLGCYLVGGSIIEHCEDGEYRNNSMLFSPSGKLITNYYKQHMFNYYGSKESDICISGEKTVIAKTPIANIGMSVCFDLRFTELYRTLANNGVDLIVVPAAWPYPRLEHWQILNRARALENQCFVVAVNQCGIAPPKRINCANSMIIDPWGSVLASAGEKEGVMMAEIDLNQAYKLREEFPLLKDRNMKAYANVKVCEYKNL